MSNSLLSQETLQPSNATKNQKLLIIFSNSKEKIYYSLELLFSCLTAKSSILNSSFFNFKLTPSIIQQNRDKKYQQKNKKQIQPTIYDFKVGQQLVNFRRICFVIKTERVGLIVFCVYQLQLSELFGVFKFGKLLHRPDVIACQINRLQALQMFKTIFFCYKQNIN